MIFIFLVRDGVPFDKGLINIFEIQGALQLTIGYGWVWCMYGPTDAECRL